MKPWHIILILILCFLCFLTGRHTKKAEVGFICKTDTFIRVDTIRDSIPYPVYETVIQTVPELFPVYITLGGDTRTCVYPRSHNTEGIPDRRFPVVHIRLQTQS